MLTLLQIVLLVLCFPHSFILKTFSFWFRKYRVCLLCFKSSCSSSAPLFLSFLKFSLILSLPCIRYNRLQRPGADEPAPQPALEMVGISPRTFMHKWQQALEVCVFSRSNQSVLTREEGGVLIQKKKKKKIKNSLLIINPGNFTVWRLAAAAAATAAAEGPAAKCAFVRHPIPRNLSEHSSHDCL